MSQTKSLALIVSALSALVSNLTDILGIAEKNLDAAFRITDKVKARREQAHVDRLLHDLAAVSRSQSVVPTYLLFEADRLDSGEAIESAPGLTSRQIAATANDLTGMIDRIRESLQARHATQLERRPELHDALAAAMDERETILAEIAKIASGEVVLTREDAPLLRSMAADYQALRHALQGYRALLGKVAAGLEG